MVAKSRKAAWVARARIVAPVAVFVLVGVGLAFQTGTGTPSSFGWDMVAAVCPLGALESLFAGGSLVPRIAIGLAVALLLIVLFGRAFCAWLCPVPRFRGLLRGKKRMAEEEQSRQQGAERSLARWESGDARPARRRFEARFAVLAGALLSSAVFGFPVFCLVCPVGLTFATFILIWRMVQFGDVTWGLLAFPAIIVLELTVLRKWCSKICPIGALMSLVPSKGKAFRVTVDHGKCQRDVKGAPCISCDIACPEGIDPFADMGKTPLSECAKCHRCAEACPVGAISLPLLSRRGKPDGAESDQCG